MINKKISKPIIIWLIIIFLPAILWLVVAVFGLIGLYGYSLYYLPLWGLEEPFFKIVSVEIRVYIPTRLGIITTAIIYSAVFWLVYFLLVLGRQFVLSNCLFKKKNSRHK